MTDPAAFAASWLSMREADDVRARSARVRDAMLRWSGRRRVPPPAASTEPLRVAELGAGTGALLRDLGARFEGALEWTLIDADRDLLALAQVQLGEWARTRGGRTRGGGVDRGKEKLHIQLGAVSIVARFRLARLTPALLGELTAGAQLVVCSALLDLAGEHFVDALVEEVATRQKALYASLTYDGRWRLRPTSSVDATTREAFHRDMQRDKGLGGPALGPSAVDQLTAELRAAGAEITTGPSDWHLEGTSPLAQNWLAGVARATGHHAFAEAGRDAITVGHTDLFAVRP